MLFRSVSLSDRIRCLFTIINKVLDSDEILYHAKIHPEQYSNTLSSDQVKELNSAIHYVCTVAMETLADSEKFPDHWLFKHRWGKGKKNQSQALPNGDKITFITVGGRTSAVVPAVQKKTGTVTKNKEDEIPNGNSNTSKRKRALKQEEDSETEKSQPETKSRGSKRQSTSAVKKEEDDDEKDNITSLGRRRSTRSRK